jgi:iron complex transport system substrate-binding protein
MHSPQMTRFAVTLTFFLLLPYAATAQLVLADDLQRPVRLPAPAQRIVSLAPSITESLFAIGAGNLICGVTDFCTYPEAARKKPHVGGMTTPSIEAIVRLQSDLILVSMEGNTRQDFDRLTGTGTPVFVTNPRSLQGIRRSIGQLGFLTGHRQEADLLLASMKAREDSIDARSGGRRVRVFLFLSLQPLLAAGSNTFINDLLQHAGADNLAARAPGTYPAISREAVLAQHPDAIIVTSDIATVADSLTDQFPEWRQLDALHTGRIYRIDPDLISRPGPRAVDGLELLFHFLHTDAQ